MSSCNRSRTLADDTAAIAAAFRPSRRAHRRVAAAAILAAAALAPSAALAAQKTFSPTAADWLGAANWTPAGVPTASDDILVNAGTSNMTISSGNVTAQFINFTNRFSRTLGNQNAGGVNSTLTLVGSGAAPLINVTDTGTFTIRGPNLSAGTGVLGLVLDASGDFNVAGPGGLTITSAISESGGARSLNKTGAGVLTLEGANTFTGDFSISNGTVSVNNLANAGVAQPLGMGTNAVTLGGASTTGTLLYTGASTSTDRGFALGAGGGGIINANEINVTSAITGTGPLAKAGAGNLTLSGAGGAITAASAVTINGGTLRLANTLAGNNNNRIGDSTAIVLNGGELRVDMDRDVPTAEVAGALQVIGGSNAVQSFTAGTAGVGTMTFSTLSRTGGVVNFDVSGGTAFSFTTAPGLANGILGGWATHGSIGWATIDPGTGNVVAYTGYNSSTNSASWIGADNISIGGSTVSVANDTTINSLRLAGSPATIDVQPGATLTLSTGGLLVVGTGHQVDASGDGSGTLTAGTTGGAQLIVTTPTAGDDVFLNAAIADNTGGAVKLVKAGPGVATINRANTHDGGTEILGGTLKMGLQGDLADSALTIGPAGTFDLNNQVRSIGSLAGSGTVQLGAGGGGDLTFGSDNSSTTFAGVIDGVGTGVGAITKVGSGTMTLTGVNTFDGAVNIGAPDGVGTGGVLVIDHDDRLGDDANTVNLYNGTLRFEDGQQVTSLLTSAPVGTQGVLLGVGRTLRLNAGNGTVDVPTGSYAEMQGLIADGTAGTSPFVKTGGGTFDMRTGNHSYSGGTIIDGGTLGVSKDANFGLIPASPDADNVILRNGGTIRWYSSGAGPTAGMNANRGLTVGTGGGVLDYSLSSGVPNLNNPITSAPGNTLTKIGTSTLLSNIAQPDMNGDLVIGQGRWNTQANGSAGNGTIYLQAPDIAPTTAAGRAQLGIGGTNLGLTITLANDIVLNPIGQGVNSFEVNGSTPTQNELILNGDISGTGGLTKGLVGGTTGTLTLGGNNTYTGENNIRLGTLQVASNANLGAAANGITLGGAGAAATLKITGNVSGAARNVTVASGGGIVDTNGFNANFGNVAGTANFAKNAAGELVVNHVRANNITVNGGTLTVAPSSVAAGVSQGNVLTIAPGARLDLKDNKLITTSPAGTATGGTYDGVQGEVQRAFNGGIWDQPGLTTSMPDAAGGLTTIGVATGEQIRGLGPTDTDVFAGQTITGASTIAMYTYAGDGNLDGAITGDDYSLIDFNIAVPGAAGYYNGDFNYDGIISGDDYSVIDFNIFAQGTPFFAGGSGGEMSGVAAVPEPASACGLALAALSAVTARCRRRAGRDGRGV